MPVEALAVFALVGVTIYYAVHTASMARETTRLARETKALAESTQKLAKFAEKTYQALLRPRLKFKPLSATATPTERLACWDVTSSSDFPVKLVAINARLEKTGKEIRSDLAGTIGAHGRAPVCLRWTSQGESYTEPKLKVRDDAGVDHIIDIIC